MTTKNTNPNILLAFIIGFTLFSFTTAVTSISYSVLTNKSTVTWTGKKPGGEHTGIVNITSGNLEMDGDLITSGEFVMDMTSIKPTDSESQKLLDHLKGEDFFNVAKFPESKLEIISSTSEGKDKNGNEVLLVTGSLTVLGKTNPITFKAVNTGKTENYIVYQSNMVIDRTKYGITYKSSLLGDAMIYDDFDLSVKIFGKKN